ncbi:MAG TPA: S8 family serine peptidase, partial [Nevskiaceae bacterium]|nr:S8 family serine peptidase [Nevskiaceae bacterium]
MYRNIAVAATAALAFFGMALVVTAAAPRNFDSPASHDTSQQFASGSVQRQDTPNDPDYDKAEPDDEDGAPATTNLYDERWDLFGFPSQLTPLAVYKDPSDSLRFGQPMVSGYNAAGAWKLTRGRGDVVIAILDTGIRWEKGELRRQVHLNCAELPAPHNAAGVAVASANASPGCKEPDFVYDLNGNGYLDVDDYQDDARVDKNGGAHGIKDTIDAEDLIVAFSDGDDDDHNGYVDDIAGWDFFNNDNDPYDQSSYFAASNHGSGRASDAVEQGNEGSGGLGVCPECQFVPLRVWDTFVADPNNFGLAVVYAADNGVSVIEGADGALGHTAFMEAASEYAYRKGLVQTFSGDDLNTGNHNYPANYSHVMLIQGTVPDSMGLGENAPSQAAAVLAQIPVPVGTQIPVLTYFRGANTTQYGGHSSISMEGATGSENTGKAAGAAGMVISAARSAGTALRPDEARAILEQTAEDITEPNTAGLGLADATQPGWDTHFGWGRVNLGAAVSLAASAKVPPEAAITAPDWYAPLTGKTLHVSGVARARFATGGAFHWKLEWGAGIAPTSFTTVREGDSNASVTDFGDIDLDAVRSALTSAPALALDPGAPVFAPGAVTPYDAQFAVRLTVTGTGLDVPGVDRRVFTAFNDATLRAGYPLRLGAGGEAPLRYADLDGDNVPELIVPTEDGVLRVLKKDGSELAGFPVYTQLQMQALNHQAAPGVAALMTATPPREDLRGPAVGDLDGDGIPEIIDAAGIHVYAWNHDGTLHAGFPVSLDLNNCKGADQKQDNVHRKCGFIGSPALGHLEGKDHGLDIVIAGLDGHLYAWRGDGSALPGFPVNLVDPAQSADQQVLAESINNAAVGDLDGDGFDDVVIATNETYAAENPSPSDLPGLAAAAFADALAQAAGSSSRVYAVSGKDGSLLPGWPLHL